MKEIQNKNVFLLIFVICVMGSLQSKEPGDVAHEPIEVTERFMREEIQKTSGGEAQPRAEPRAREEETRSRHKEEETRESVAQRAKELSEGVRALQQTNRCEEERAKLQSCLRNEQGAPYKCYDAITVFEKCAAKGNSLQ